MQEFTIQHGMRRLTRQFEANLPSFKSHLEARQWFKEKFGDWEFQMAGSEDTEDGEIYFYHLILNKENYLQYREMAKKQAEQQGIVAMSPEDFKLMFSYHSVEIWEDGNVHIVF